MLQSQCSHWQKVPMWQRTSSASRLDGAQEVSHQSGTLTSRGSAKCLLTSLGIGKLVKDKLNIWHIN